MVDITDRFGQQLLEDLFEQQRLSDFEELIRRRRLSEFETLIGQLDARDRELARRTAEEKARRTAIEASKRSALFRRASQALKLLGRGLVGFELIGFEIEVIKALREKEDFESLRQEEALNEWIRQKLARKTKEKKLRTTSVQRDTQGAGIPPEPPNGGATKTVLRVPASRPTPIPQPAPDPIRIPFPGDSGIRPPDRPDIADPTTPTVGPLRDPRIVVAPFPLPPLATPGFNPKLQAPRAPGPTPTQFQSPFASPRLKTQPRFAFPSLTSFGTELVQFPQVSPSPATRTAPRRAPTDERRRRQKCYKGLYKEKRDGSLTKTRWAQIDCDTGEEFGKKPRRKKEATPETLPSLATFEGFSIRPIGN